ncbi:MAG: hypothetical protein LBO20_09835 [Bifidobacteriaceae bacterium]|jgi:Cft2 family RNA processing exonuclease|nr:hypothetical protein [Bifidobacteriaceae bacterium]
MFGIVILPSALKHGVAPENIRPVFRRLAAVGRIGLDPDKRMLIGFDSNGRLLEVAAVFNDDGTVGGVPLTAEMLETWAAEAEAGYSPDQLTPAPLPKGMAWASDERRAVVLRLPVSLDEALADRAAATHQSKDELATQAIANLLVAGG